VALLQQLNLAERLLKRNGDGQLTKDDLVAIARIIGDQPNDGAEADRVLRLAKSAAEKAESLKIPGGLVRTRYAQRLEAKAGTNESELRVAWKDAADNGEADGLSERDRIHALQKFRNLAKGIDRVDTDLELLKIAIAGNHPSRFKHWLNALELAVQAKNRALADKVLARKPPGEFAGEAAARRDRLLGLYEKLPKSN